MTRGKGLWLGVAVAAAIAIGLVLLLSATRRDGRTPQGPPGDPPAGARIVPMSPGIAVMLRDLGLADRVVGRHAYDLVLPKSVPVCGDELVLDFEALLGVRPTHVLLQLGRKPMPDRLIRLGEEQGWTIHDYQLLGFDDVPACVDRLAREFSAEPARLAELQARMSSAWSRRGEGFAKAGRVLLLGAVAPPSALGPGSWHHGILERIGGVPAITEGAPYISLDAEEVLRLAPDAIVLILPRSPDAPAAPPPPTDDLKRLLGRIGTLDIPAIRAGRVAIIDDPLAHTPSTAMIGLADELARTLDGWSR